MKVLHVITGLGDGGAEAMLYRLCSHLPEVTHVVVSLMDEGKYGPLLRDAGVAVHCLGMPRGRLTGRGLLSLWQLMRRERPDVVQTWMYHANLVGGVVARLAGVRAISWGIHHSALEPGKASMTTIAVARVCSLLSYVVPRKIVFCSGKSAQMHKDIGYCFKKIAIIPNGYDLSCFRPDSESREKQRSEWGVSEEMPLLGMVARYDPLKDHRTLLSSLSLLKRKGLAFRCVFVGSGMNRDNKEVLSQIEREELDETIILAGKSNDVPGVMNALDLHVLSSLSEAFPNVLAEAMACGTPCVTTDVGDAALIVGDAGWVVRPEAPEDLADNIEKALSFIVDKQRKSKISKSARLYICNNFEINHVACVYLDAWSCLKK